MSIGTKKLVHIAFVVRDLDKVVDAWTKILGIERPEYGIYRDLMLLRY